MTDIKYCGCCGKLIDDIRKECIECGTYDDSYDVYRHNHHECYMADSEIDGGLVYTKNLELTYCEHCGAPLGDEDVLFCTESHEFWGAPGPEEFVLGYRCSNCGVEERF